jgi:hypothetical protein
MRKSEQVEPGSGTESSTDSDGNGREDYITVTNIYFR